MEAEAVSFTIHVAQSAKFLPIIMELDSKEIVNLSCNKKGIKTAIFWTIATIQAKLKELKWGTNPTCSERLQYYCPCFSENSFRL